MSTQAEQGVQLGGPDSRSMAFTALIACVLCISFSGIFVRLADVGPTASAFWRVALASPVLAVIAATQQPGSAAASRLDASALGLLLLSGLFFAGDIGVWHWSLQWTSVANSTLLSNTASIFVTLTGWLAYRERIRLGFAMGLAVALAGIALLLSAGLGLRPGGFIGDGLGLLTGAFYGAYIVVLSRLRTRFSVSFVMLATCVLTALILLPIAVMDSERLLPSWPWGWAPLAGLAVVSQLSGQSLLAYALRHLPMSLCSAMLLLQPVVAAAVAALLFGEHMTVLEMLGGATVLAGIWLCKRASTG